MTGQDRTGLDTTGQAWIRQARPGYDRTGQDRAGQDWTEQHRTINGRTGLDRAGHGRIGQCGIRQERIGQGMIGR